MNFTLYCYGDIELFSGGLRAVAMLFDPFTGSIVGESGLEIGPLTALALLISLGGIAITGISRQRVNVDHLLVLVLVFGVMFIPKTDLNIEDVITGKVDIVEDVPIGVAAVGGVVSHISLVLAENFETVFSIPSGAPAPWESQWTGMGFGTGSGGMNSPLRMLQATRGILVGDHDHFLNTDLAFFVRECTQPPFSWEAYHAVPAKMDYLMTNHSPGITNYFDPVLGDFRAMSCADAKGLLAPRLDEYFKDEKEGKFSQVVCANMGTPPEYSGADIACGDGAVAEAFGRLLPELSASGVTAAAFMKDLMLSKQVQATIGCGAPVNEDDFRLCLTTMTDAMEQSRVQNAAAASGFQKIMIPAMNMFLFLFYAISPLIAVVIAASGMMGLSIAGKYLLFGVWSHSWLPVAVVIDYFMEASVKQELHNYSLAYLNGNFDGTRFYDIIADHISVASDLLAATPLVTLAIITGSMFSMTSVANRMGARDHVDETKLAPSTLKQDALTTNSYDKQSYGGVGTQAVTQRGGQVAFLSDQAMEQSHKLDASMVRTAGQAFAQQQSANYQRASEQAMEKGAQDLGQSLARWGNSTSSGSETSAAYQQLKSTGLDFNHRYGTEEKLSDAAAAVLGAAYTASGKLGLPSALKLAGTLGAEAGLSAEDRQKVERSLAKGYTEAQGSSVSLKSGADAKFAQSVKESESAIHELSGSAAKSFSEGAKLSDKASTSVADIAQWTRDVGTQGRLANGQSARIAPMLQNAMLTDGSLAGRMVDGISSAVAGMVSKANASGADGTALGTAFNNRVQAHDEFLRKNGQFQDPQQRKAMAMLDALASVASGGVANKNNEPEFANAALGQVLKEFAPQLNLGAGSGKAGLSEQVQGRIGQAERQVPGSDFGARMEARVRQGEQDVVNDGNRINPPTEGAAAAAFPGMTQRVMGKDAEFNGQLNADPVTRRVNQEQTAGRAYLQNEAMPALEAAGRALDKIQGVADAGRDMATGWLTTNGDALNAGEAAGKELADSSPALQRQLSPAARDYFAKSYAHGFAQATGKDGYDDGELAKAAQGLSPQEMEKADALAAQAVDFGMRPSTQRDTLEHFADFFNGSPGGGPTAQDNGSGADPTAEKKTITNGISLGPTSVRYAENIQHWNKAITTAKGEDYANLVADEAVRQGVDPYLAVAVAAAESSFNPNAGSNKGAQGLMQLIPSTARGLGLDPEERTDPAKNAQAGVRYLAQQLARHDGDVTLALAAYNAGPGAVERWDNEVPPYPETQAYVARVTDITHHLRAHARRQS